MEGVQYNKYYNIIYMQLSNNLEHFKIHAREKEKKSQCDLYFYENCMLPR